MGEIRDAIRSNLERYISESGYTQKEIADKLGVSKSSITNWIKGKNSPDVELVVPICKLLNITVRDFYGEAGPEPEQRIQSPLSSGEQDHIKKYRFLDLYGKEAVDNVLDVEHRRCAEKAQSLPEVERLVYVNPAAAGSPLYAESDFERLTFPESDVPPGADFGIRISGRSMEPTVPDGCIAWVHKTVDLDDGVVGIFMLNDSATCKRYFKNDDGTFRLESDNLDYGPVEVSEFDTVVPVGEVIGTV